MLLELVLLFDKKIYNYYSMTNNYSDAEDLAQEVFLKVYRNLKNFRKKTASFHMDIVLP